MSDVKFYRVYSSDFTRARETAEYILKHSTQKVPEIIIDERVRERVRNSFFLKVSKFVLLLVIKLMKS